MILKGFFLILPDQLKRITAKCNTYKPRTNLAQSYKVPTVTKIHQIISSHYSDV